MADQRIQTSIKIRFCSHGQPRSHLTNGTEQKPFDKQTVTTLGMEFTECIEDKKVLTSLPLGPKRSHSNQVNNFTPFPFLRPF